MKKIHLLLAALVSMASLARAGNVTTYPNVSSVTSADLFFDWQSGTQQNATAAQLKTYLLGGGTLAIASGKTLTSNNTLTFTGTDGSSVNFGSGGTVLYSSGIGSSAEAWSARLDALAALSPPATSGYLLSSNASGGLSWIAPTVTATASGTNTYTATPSPALAAYTTGLSILVKFTNANTGGASLNLNGLGAVTIQQLGTTVAAGQIPAGATLNLVYDGSYFQIVGAQSAGYAFASPLVNTTGTVALTVGSSGGVEAWSANLDTLAAGNPLTAGSNITFSGTWPNVTIAATSGTYTLPAATTGSLGGVIPDGATITVDGFGDIAVGSVPWSDINSVPTSVAALGITNGSTIDMWGALTIPSGSVVGTTATQTLTNKSISYGQITGITFPSSAIVGLSDSQTLTNKSIAASEINSGTLAVNQGGTGAGSFTAYAPLFGGTTSTGAVQSGTVGTAGQVLTSNGSGALPTFQNVPDGWTLTNIFPYTAVAGQKIWPYATSGTITLPSGGNTGDTIQVGDFLGSASSGFATEPVTVTSSISIESSRGTSTLQVLNRNYEIATFVYDGFAGQWWENDSYAPLHLTGTLSSGSVTITNAAITTSSIIEPVHKGTSLTNAGALYIKALSSGTVTIDSTNSSDSDGITLLIQ